MSVLVEEMAVAMKRTYVYWAWCCSDDFDRPHDFLLSSLGHNVDEIGGHDVWCRDVRRLVLCEVTSC